MRLWRVLAIMLALMMVASCALADSPAEGALERLNDGAYQATYDALKDGQSIKQGDKGDAYKGLQQLLKDVGIKVSVDGDIGPGTIAAVNELAELIADPEVTTLPVEEVDEALFSEMVQYALCVKDMTSFSMFIFSADDMFDRMSYYSAARLILEDGNKSGACTLYQQIAPYRNCDKLIEKYS